MLVRWHHYYSLFTDIYTHLWRCDKQFGSTWSAEYEMDLFMPCMSLLSSGGVIRSAVQIAFNFFWRDKQLIKQRMKCRNIIDFAEYAAIPPLSYYLQIIISKYHNVHIISGVDSLSYTHSSRYSCSLISLDIITYKVFLESHIFTIGCCYYSHR